MERWGAQGVTLVVSIVLARILEPKAYGTIALITVFITLLQVFVDSGLGTALIQKKDADDLDFSSVFWFNIGVCIFLYLLMFFGAPFIARFYNKPDIIPVIRVLSLLIIISGIKSIQQAYVSRNMMFKKFFFSTLGGTVGAAFVGIWMAYNGYGVWALVAQYLFNNLMDTTILWLTVKWRPRFCFSFQRFKELYSYGWKILVSSLIDTVYNEIRALIIGKYYTSEDLAYYTKGQQFPNYVVQNINASMNSVLLPVLAKKQDDKNAVKDATRKVIKTSSYVIWPMMIGLCVVSSHFITVVLTEKWLPATFYLQVLCFDYVLQPLQTTNLSVIKALGRSDLHLKMEILKKLIAIGIVIISSLFGVKYIALGTVLYSIIASVINSYPNRELIHYGYVEQIKDILPFAALSIMMGTVVYFVRFIPMSPVLTLITEVIVGIATYIVLSIIFRIDTYYYYVGVLRKILRK